MAKAILELEMPESCWECPCSWRMKNDVMICKVIMHYCPEEGRHKYCPLKSVEKGRGEKMVSISKQEGLKIVQAMRMLKLLDEQFFNDIDGAERLMNDLTLFVIGKEDEK